jgi:outer membrane protein OmpA-like peptidoglycan-associated protein
MWLRQLAQNFWNAKDCVEISGHSSRTGSAELNDKLSAYRAEAVMRYMMLTEPRLQSKTKWIGKGFHENIVGTGADDASDAVDRRVEFKTVPCP